MSKQYGYVLESFHVKYSHEPVKKTAITIFRVDGLSNDDNGYLYKSEIIKLEWQTHFDYKADGWRPWYGGELKSAEIRYVDDVNEFASLARRIIRNLDGGDFYSRTSPFEMVEVMKKMRISPMVYDARIGGYIWKSDVKSNDFQMYNAVVDNDHYKGFLATSEKEAKDAALAWFAERAEWNTNNRERFSRWIAQGMKIENQFRELPDVRGEWEIINDGIGEYRNYNGELTDQYGNVVEVDQSAIDEMAAGLDEEE